MGKGRFVDKREGTVTDSQIARGHQRAKEWAEVDELRAKVAELEKELEHLKREHQLELENVTLRLETKVRELEYKIRSAYPLASMFLEKFDELFIKEMEAARAAAVPK